MSLLMLLRAAADSHRRRWVGRPRPIWRRRTTAKGHDGSAHNGSLTAEAKSAARDLSESGASLAIGPRY